jgi:hypothetical protein
MDRHRGLSANHRDMANHHANSPQGSSNVNLVGKNKSGRPVRKLNQVHTAVEIEDLAQNNRRFIESGTAGTVTYRPAEITRFTYKIKGFGGTRCYFHD